jgi:glycosyltransferase involved in cell wall biosynthesis
MYNKKIVFIGFFPGFGGAEKSLITTANQLSKSGYNVSIIAIRHNNFVYNIETSINIYFIEDKSNVKFFTISWRLINLFKLLKKIKPHFVISFWLQPAIISLLIKPFIGFKAIYSERGDPSDKEYKGLLGFFRDISFRMLDSIVFQTYAAQNLFNHKIKEKSIVIYNPITLNKIYISSQLRKEKRIVNVGRLHPQKNQKLLIEAFSLVTKSFPEYILEIYGDGELKNELLKFIKFLRISDKVFIYEPCSDIHSKIVNSSIFVLSSDYEGMPNALLEAMSLGMPCISTDWRPGAIHEFIKHGFNGLIVKANDAVELAEAIKFALLNPNNMKLISDNSKNIINLYNLERYTNDWNYFLNKL